MSELSSIRSEYSAKPLRREEMPNEPFQFFETWFSHYQSLNPVEPNAMVLSTVGNKAEPTQRTVLLKAFDQKGFVFFTNYRSRKAQHIESNSQVSLLFPWYAAGRQVHVEGEAQLVTRAESLKYFVSRPRGSQLGAWVSDQSAVVRSRAILVQSLQEARKKYGDGDIPLPWFWGGYRVVPRRIEFWQGNENRLHDRFVYERADGKAEDWQLWRLAP